MNGALADRVMYDARLKEATQFRAKLVAEEDAACAVLQMQMEDLRMRVKEVEENVWTATQHRKVGGSSACAPCRVCQSGRSGNR